MSLLAYVCLILWKQSLTSTPALGCKVAIARTALEMHCVLHAATAGVSLLVYPFPAGSSLCPAFSDAACKVGLLAFLSLQTQDAGDFLELLLSSILQIFSYLY